MSAKTPPFTQRSADRYRSGCWPYETVLTSEHVQKNGIRHLGDCYLDDPRSTEGEPLSVSGVMMRDGLPHDVIFAADMSCRAYAFDIDTCKPLWKQTIGNPVNIVQYGKQYDFWSINPSWGVLGTGAISVEDNAWYLISLSSADGSMGKGTYRFHTLSLTDGSDLAPPLVLDNATFTPPDGSKPIVLGAIPRKQRAGLAIDTRNGHTTIFAAFSTFAESSLSNVGMVLAIDVTATNKPYISAVWVTGWQHPPCAGIWAAGEAPALDDDGYIYLLTGNGGFNASTDFGECFVKLQYTPPDGSSPASLVCVDHWSPFSDAGAVGQDPTQPQVAKGTADNDDMSPDSHLVPTNTFDTIAGKPTNVRNPITDEDLGSGGATLFPSSISGYSKSAVYGGGKHGVGYPVNKDNMGKTQNADFAPSKIAENYAKLLSQPVALTFDGTSVDLMPSDMTMLPVLPNGRTAHIHGTPRYYKSSDHGWLLYEGGENTSIRVFKINPDLSLTYLACTQETASPECGGFGGMPGWAISIACNGQGTNTAILIGVRPRGDANKEITDGDLIIWGANWVDGNRNLIKLWDSSQWNWQFKFNKFNKARAWLGRVILPTYDGRIMICG